MNIAHFSDLHYANETLTEVDRCFTFAVDAAINAAATVAVISGDATDHRLDLHSPAVMALAKQVQRLSLHMPVLMIQGTFSHEPPGALSIFRCMNTRYPVCVADRVCQAAITEEGWIVSAGWRFEAIPKGTKCLFTVLPTINRGVLAAHVDAERSSALLGETLASLLAGFAEINATAASKGIPSVGASHGTVNGCVSEHGVTMASRDHEFATATLFSANVSAWMLGHIHKHQSWKENGRCIAYAGSVGRLHYGEIDPKGFLLWEVLPLSAGFTFVETPARTMLSADFNGAPDMDELREIAARSDGAFVRIRWQIDEEHRHAVNREAIENLFAGAFEVKLEGRILPVRRTRAEGMNRMQSMADKLRRWCSVSRSDFPPLEERLDLLLGMEAGDIAEKILD